MHFETPSFSGHQWLLNYLGVRPKSSWSVDPFGHGGTFPYILKSSGLWKKLMQFIRKLFFS
jgi:alpha-mannosidase